jgi:hypothetical protein
MHSRYLCGVGGSVDLRAQFGATTDVLQMDLCALF